MLAHVRVRGMHALLADYLMLCNAHSSCGLQVTLGLVDANWNNVMWFSELIEAVQWLLCMCLGNCAESCAR